VALGWSRSNQLDVRDLEKSYWGIYANYRSLVLPMEVKANGKTMTGTAFHIGDGYFVTARHNVEGVDSFRLLDLSREEEEVEIGQVLSGASLDCDLAALFTTWKDAHTESHHAH
jgi:S1-C subfamily serine protease